MNKLVKNLLVLNQLESGKDETVMERFDIVSLIQGVLQTMDIMIQQKEAAVIFQEQAPVYVCLLYTSHQESFLDFWERLL